jgi:hypothetical protein
VTVAELIAELQKMPPDMRVVVETPEDHEMCDVEWVERDNACSIAAGGGSQQWDVPVVAVSGVRLDRHVR